MTVFSLQWKILISVIVAMVTGLFRLYTIPHNFRLVQSDNVMKFFAAQKNDIYIVKDGYHW